MLRAITHLTISRLDGLATPRTASSKVMNGSGMPKTGQFQTPSISRIKADPASSPPDFKTPYKPGERQIGTPYGTAVHFRECS